MVFKKYDCPRSDKSWGHVSSLVCLFFHLVDFVLHSGSIGLPKWRSGKESAAMEEMRVRFLGWEDPLEEEVATHCSILAWKIPWTRSLVGCRPWGGTELVATVLSSHATRHMSRGSPFSNLPHGIFFHVAIMPSSSY